MPFIGTEKVKIQLQDGEILIPAVLGADNGEELLVKYDSFAKDSFKNLRLNFEKCRRFDSGGLRALSQLGEKAKADNKQVEIVNIDNTPYKSLKLTGKVDDPVFCFPHRGNLGTGVNANLPNC